MAWRGVAWRGVAWRGVAWLRVPMWQRVPRCVSFAGTTTSQPPEALCPFPAAAICPFAAPLVTRHRSLLVTTEYKEAASAADTAKEVHKRWADRQTATNELMKATARLHGAAVAGHEYTTQVSVYVNHQYEEGCYQVQKLQRGSCGTLVDLAADVAACIGRKAQSYADFCPSVDPTQPPAAPPLVDRAVGVAHAGDAVAAVGDVLSALGGAFDGGNAYATNGRARACVAMSMCGHECRLCATVIACPV